MSRTPSTQALEALAWHLNFFPGKTLSINEVAEDNGLAWATARKFLATLELIRKIAPTITLTPDGVRVQAPAKLTQEILEEPMARAAIYLFLHSRLEGDPSHPIGLESHRQFQEQFKESIDDLVGLGLAERKDGTIRLTPAGLGLASQAYGEIVDAVPESFEAAPEAAAEQTVRMVRSPTEDLLVDDAQTMIVSTMGLRRAGAKGR